MKKLLLTIVIVLTVASSAFAEECKRTHTITYPDGRQKTYCLDE